MHYDIGKFIVRTAKALLKAISTAPFVYVTAWGRRRGMNLIAAETL
jgi:hypothetical protein